MVVHACNPSTQKTEAGKWPIQDELVLYGKTPWAGHHQRNPNTVKIMNVKYSWFRKCRQPDPEKSGRTESVGQGMPVMNRKIWNILVLDISKGPLQPSISTNYQAHSK